MLLWSIACTCASIVAQKRPIGISTLSVPKGSTNFVPITMRNMIIMDARKTTMGVIQPIAADQTTLASRKKTMKLVIVIAS